MKTSTDIPINPLDKIRKLAATAPKEEPRKAPERPRSKGEGLGKLDVGKYLDHYGVEYTEKKKAGFTLYVLRECLFDPNHRGKEASIVQADDGLLSYQCFHDSCRGRTWAEARAIISNDDSLAQFCEGYDPEKTRAARKAPSLSPQNIEQTDLVMQNTPSDWRRRFGDKVSPPEDINPQTFYEKRNNRWTFIPLRMAQYLLALRQGHVVFTAGEFWVYRHGVWVTCDPAVFGQDIVKALGDEARPHAINGAIQILQNLVAKEMSEWPTHENYVNCLSGMVNLETGQVEPHDPKFWSRSQVPCHFGMEHFDKLKRWFEFLEEIWPGEQEAGKADVLQEFMGYCLVPHCRYQRALFLYGQGANGKSVLLNVIEDMVGGENVSALSIHDLSERFNRSMLAGKLVNVCYETDSRSPASMETFKAATAGDIIKAEEKYGRPFKFRNYAKFVIAMNDPPVFGQASTYNIMRRLLVMKFNRVFKEEEQDPELSDKLREERHGIFMWALMGYERLAKRGRFLEPAEMLKVKRDFEKEISPMTAFVEERLELTSDEKAVLRRSELYDEYKEWAKDGSYRAVSKQKFYRYIEGLPGVVPTRIEPNRVRGYRGVRFKSLDS